jgi:hypothetical protein
MPKRYASCDIFTTEVLREAGDLRPLEMLPLADALVLLHGDSALDRALTLAHDLNATYYQEQVRAQVLVAAADDLRSRLAHIEELLRRVA